MNPATPRITPETIHFYAYTNASLLSEPPRAIVLTFHGLGFCGMRTDPDPFETLCAQEHILTVFPYFGPWSWMNREAVQYVDDILAALRMKWNLPESTPVIASGGSMGGLSALIYTLYARTTPKACFANCPVCDLPFHATERPDLPRTVYLAFAHYECGLEEALQRTSPLHQARKMPKIPYTIIHGDADQAVNKALHSDRFVAAMRAAGHDVTYIEVPGMPHCDFSAAPQVRERWYNSLIAACK